VAGISTVKDKHKEDVKTRLLELVDMAKKADVTEEEFIALVKDFYCRQ
jgi:DNA-binding transcriptional regulator YhcF (GntR family)